MEIRQLISFVKIVQMKSFSRAAEDLGYSQSALTVQIRLLEQELNTRLFDRVGKQIALTGQGQRFLTYAQTILHEVNRAKLSLAEEGELTDPLHIGTIESLCFSRLPPILHYFQKHHPKVTIRITTGSPEELMEMMEKNRLDLIYILDEPRYHNHWNKVMERKEEIVFVTSPESLLNTEKDLQVETLLKEPFFLTEKDANYRRALDQFLASKNMVVTPALEVSNTEFIIQMLRQNRGISFLPRLAVQKNVERGQLQILHVADFQLYMYGQIFYHKDKWKTREMEAFIRLSQGEKNLC